MTEGAGAAPREPPRLRRPVFTLVVLAAVVSGVFLAFMNLIVDLAVGFIDPRIRTGA